ncbi:GNAT family N-acetyltransferase [Kribbella sp. NPDC023855]|uniref:GNAT family N-acetyltransferase n=1 Tax=Kribbella sp. NPDC023855 TaxID=3154698 RepID=UPI00340E22EA
MEELVRRWQHGWGLCRGLAAAQERDGVLDVKLGLPGRDHELFTLTDRTELVSALANEVARATEPTWLTVTTHRQDAAAAVLEGAGLRVFAEPSLLMSIDLEKHPDAAAPAEYRLEAWSDGPLEHVRLIDAHGNVAARGMAAVVGRDAVMHDIQTDPAHRRRGLGSVVMGKLSRRAVERGAAVGLLMATTDGGHLYTKLGWSTEAPMLTATSQPN